MLNSKNSTAGETAKNCPLAPGLPRFARNDGQRFARNDGGGAYPKRARLFSPDGHASKDIITIVSDAYVERFVRAHARRIGWCRKAV